MSMTLLSRLRGDHRSQRGAAAVEFALLVPILLALVFGMIEFGRLFNAQITLQHAVREGVRDFAVHQDHDQAVDITVDAASLIGLTKDDVDVPSDCTPGDPTTVSANYPFTYLVWDFGSGGTLEAKGAMRCGG